MKNTYIAFTTAAAALVSARTLPRDASQTYNVPGWTYYGCYSDSVYQRGLSYKPSIDSTTVTPNTCAAACQAAGYTLASVEYGDECYCDNFIHNQQSNIAESLCDMSCSGDSSLACGGAAAMSLFSSAGSPQQAVITPHDPTLPSGWSSLGCWSDSVTARALSTRISTPSTGLTVEFCIASCQAAGFSYAGVEYAGECYCDNSINNNQNLTTDGGCNMQCSGDAGETCGGAARIDMYTSAPLPAGSIVSFHVTTPLFTSYYLAHESDVVQIETPSGAGATESWIVHPGNADSSCYTFESLDTPGNFLRHQGFLLWVQPNDQTTLFAQDSTFCAQPGNDGQGLSFHAFNYPTRYIRHFNGRGTLASDGGPLDWDTQITWTEDTSFIVAPASF